MINKYLNMRLFIIAGIISLVWVTISYFTISSRINTLTMEKYVEVSNRMKDFLEVFISEKQETVSLISLILAHDANIQKSLINRNSDSLELQNYSKQLKKHTLLQNVWIQIIEPDGKSLYRSWSSKSGDDLSGVRLDV